MQYEINHIHLELSSLCNARCPFCPRGFLGYPHNMGFNETNLSLADFKRIFSLTRLSRVHIAIINGNFGDAIMNQETTDIIAYMRQANPKMSIRLHTNGGARDKTFWQDMARLGVICVFGIDGLSDTHSLYRQDTVFENVIRNAKIFINAGGNAVWMANIFDRTIHQVDEMERMSKELGFMQFEQRRTDRDNGPSYDRQGKKVFYFATDWNYPDQIDQTFIETQIQRGIEHREEFKIPGKKKIDCWAKRERSVYVASDGYVYPCCWTGFNPQSYRNHNAVRVWNEELCEYVGGNHGPTVGLEAAIAWFDKLSASWETDSQPTVCKQWCGSNNE